MKALGRRPSVFICFEVRVFTCLLKWKNKKCLISDENLVVFHLVLLLVLRFIHLTQMEVIYWLLTAWIINVRNALFHPPFLPSSLQRSCISYGRITTRDQNRLQHGSKVSARHPYAVSSSSSMQVTTVSLEKKNHLQQIFATFHLTYTKLGLSINIRLLTNHHPMKVPPTIHQQFDWANVSILEEANSTNNEGTNWDSAASWVTIVSWNKPFNLNSKMLNGQEDFRA